MPEIQRLAIPAGETPDNFRRVVGAAYTAWVGSGSARLPDVNDVMEYTGSMTRKVVGRILGSEEFTTAIQARGVPWHTGGGLTAQQMLALSVMTDPTNRKNPAAKLKAVGVSYGQYRAWLKEPLFKRKLDQITESMVQDHIADMQVALTNKAVNGDLNAIKFVYEMTGKHDPASKEVIQLKAVITMLLEVLSRHLSAQPELLQAVAVDIQKALPQSIQGEVIR
jgi:hypothetical protein